MLVKFNKIRILEKIRTFNIIMKFRSVLCLTFGKQGFFFLQKGKGELVFINDILNLFLTL